MYFSSLKFIYVLNFLYIDELFVIAFLKISFYGEHLFCYNISNEKKKIVKICLNNFS